MSQSAANLKITQKMSPLLPLAGLPRRKLTGAEMQIAAARVKEQTEQRVMLGKKLFTAAESHTKRTQEIINELKTDQEKFAKLLRGDVAKTLRSYDRWMGKLDEHVTEEVAKLNYRLGAMEVKWSQAEDRLKAITAENDSLISQMKLKQEQHQVQTKRLIINTFKSLIEKNAFQARPAAKAEVVTEKPKDEPCITDHMSLEQINAMKPVRVGPGQSSHVARAGVTAGNDSSPAIIKAIEPKLKNTETIKIENITLTNDEETAWMVEEAELNLVEKESDEDSEFTNSDHASWQYDFEFDEETEAHENQATTLRNMASSFDQEAKDADDQLDLARETAEDTEIATDESQEQSLTPVLENTPHEKTLLQDAVSDAAIQAAEAASEAASRIAQDLADGLDGKAFDEPIIEEAPVNKAKIDASQSILIADEIQDLLIDKESHPETIAAEAPTVETAAIETPEAETLATEAAETDYFQEQIQAQFTEAEAEAEFINIDEVNQLEPTQSTPLSEQLTESGVKQLLLDMLSDADVVAKLRDEQLRSETLADAASKEIEQKQIPVTELFDIDFEEEAENKPAPSHHIYRQVRKWMNGK